MWSDEIILLGLRQAKGLRKEDGQLDQVTLLQ